ncbi:Flp family type IVb pilin [Rhodopirellula sp. JC740]|uniref:Flp family type IVb pilin n=1 Tax=Rhodopirellula halodulae TaxID=2894198 RepID=A0ABS8NIP5_9BACT|nr:MULTISPECIES: Flp family type IVb pilin [unclassified Rhodopirellula]MCC9643427.1 Flp family type IVb pilin [Rhodopirellula sp. JC740]MCC9658181.1 Flp family type IVb pilin [Rhodopirellula sp. JC737]
MSRSNVWRSIRHFMLEEDGPTAVEYAVMLAMIIVVASVGINILVTETSNSLNHSSDAIAN